jgi:hypothetical protein
MPTRASGTLQDNEKRSYVESPTRTGDTAQEVYIGHDPDFSLTGEQYRHFMFYQSRILAELKKISSHLSLINEIELGEGE